MRSLHRIFVRHRGVEPSARLPIKLIKHCIRAALRAEGLSVPCEVSVLITNDKGIRRLNCKFRGIDKPTDVLSFPMQARKPGEYMKAPFEVCPETGLAMLGDIVMSAERVNSQAQAYGLLPEHEAAYLTVHSVLHLLGYDHIDSAEMKRIMRRREKEIMRELGT